MAAWAFSTLCNLKITSSGLCGTCWRSTVLEVSALCSISVFSGSLLAPQTVPTLLNPSTVLSSVLDFLNTSCMDPTQGTNSAIFFGSVQPKLDLFQLLWFPTYDYCSHTTSYLGILPSPQLLAQLLPVHGLVEKILEKGL